MSTAKRMKRDTDQEENVKEGYWDQETQQALEEIDSCQNQIDLLNEKASEDILKVEQKYNKLRKPFFEKRNKVIQKIENFWITAFVNHPQITSLLDEDEEDCLHHLSKLEVEEFEDIKFGYRIKFYFDPNQYFENDVLTKEFHLGAPVPCSKSTPIQWKEGQNIIEIIKERNERNQRGSQGKKRKPECRTFFTWYEEDCDPTADEIAEVIKDDLWPNPLQYYLSPDIEVDTNGVEDDGRDDDDEDASDEEEDDSVVILEDMEEGTEDEDTVIDLVEEENQQMRSSANSNFRIPPTSTPQSKPPMKTLLKTPIEGTHTHKKRKQYSDEDMKSAILAVRNGSETMSSAARKFGVPRVTLYDKLTGRSEESCRLGRKPLLSEEEENALVKWVVGCKTRGFIVTKQQLIDSAGQMFTKMGKPNPFHKGKPGNRWVDLFMGRHKNLPIRECQTRTTPLADVTEESLSAWCEEVKTYCTQHNLMGVLVNPKRIFNCNEFAFLLSPKTGKVIATRSDRSVYNVSGNTDKENVTVLMNVRADGAVAPPMILYAYERIPLDVAMAVPIGWGIGKSETGWMTSETFFDYMSNVFEPYLMAENIERPIIMFMDGYIPYMSLELSEFCASKQIELVALLPNATHLLQPLDVAVFDPLKNAWKKKVSEWRVKNSCQKIEKEDFPSLLQSVITDVFKPHTVKNGFKTCGLMSLDPKDIDMTKLVRNLDKEPKQCVQGKVTSVETDKISSVLSYVESKVGLEKIKVFRQGGPIKKRDEALYQLWLDINKDLKTSLGVIEDETNLNNESNPGNEINATEQSRSIDDKQLEEEKIDESDINIEGPEAIQEQNIIMNESAFSDLGLHPSMTIDFDRDLPVTVIPSSVESNAPTAPLSPPLEYYHTSIAEPSTSKVLHPIGNFTGQWEIKEKRQQEKKASPAKMKKQKVEKKKIEKTVGREVESNSDSSEDESKNENKFKLDLIEKEKQLDIKGLRAGQWVIVPYQTGKKEKRFIGQIISVNGDETCKVKFLVQKRGTFVWPVVEDVDDSVPLVDIIDVLKEPVFKRRGRMQFVL